MPKLLGQIRESNKVGTVTADGSCETWLCHAAIFDRQPTPICPIRKNGRPWKEDRPARLARNETLASSRHDGGAVWKRCAGYLARSRIRAKMHCLKAFGDRIAAVSADRQTAEIQIRIAPENRFAALRDADRPRGLKLKGKVALTPHA